ncbi:response regulator transcription factor [Microbacterium rhizophilus]|uniref:response regulator transcription factor n=1 Tax=Microbacterium rhizophilus TaxID=3138934 RepID=UPI0031E58299
MRILVAEDQPLIREGIVRLLEQAGMTVEAVRDAVSLRERAEADPPDVVVTDIQMPPGMGDDGLEVALSLRRSHPQVGVVVLSQYLDDRYALDLVGDRADGVGYLLKEKIARGEVLVDAVRRVADGGSALDPDVVARLVGRRRPVDPLASLTPRERETLSLMAEGHSNAGIAQKLFVTVPAVERHVTGIFTKLGLQQTESGQHRRVLAVLRYLDA